MKPILIDLDGTLHDSVAIIKQTFGATLKECLGRTEPPEYFTQFIGPPLLQGFTRMGASDPAKMVMEYRIRYEKNMLDTPCFPGMEELVKKLHDAGVPLAIATSKKDTNSRTILEHQGLAQYIDVIAGDPETRPGYSKADVVEDALNRLSALGVDTSEALMVGDRIYDIEGAGKNGVPTVMVTWGAGRPEEWELAWKHVDTVDQLETLLFGFARGEIRAEFDAEKHRQAVELNAKINAN